MWSVATLRSNSKWTHQITQQVFCEWTHWVLSQFWSKCTHNVPEPLIESSFKEYLKICPQYTQSYTQWVLWEFVVKLNHIESLLGVLWKEPTGHIVCIFWVFFERTLNEWLRHIVGTFWSKLWKNPVGSFTKYLLGNLMGSFWIWSQCSHRSHWDQNGE